MSDRVGSLKRIYAEFRRRRVFRVVAVYVVVSWILIQVASVVFAPFGLPDWSMRLLIILLGLGFVLAFALAWSYDFGPQGLERTAPAQAVASAPDASVAILPFADMSESRDQGYFCDGLAEEILDVLASVRGLRVASRTSSFRFRNGDTDAREIGRALNVAAVMEGSVRKSGERLRVTAQLIDARNGYHVWSEHFDRKLEDVFAIQDEIARGIAQALRVSLKTPEMLDRQRYAPRDMQAYDFYLRGRGLEDAKDKTKWSYSAQMFRRAIELDPDYAQAHAGLADVLVQLMQWRFVRPEEVLDEARKASQRALELAPELADAHVAHAHILEFSGEHDAATVEFERALTLNPGSYEANYSFARYCFARGGFARAVELFEAAHRVNPDEFQALSIAVSAAESLGNNALADGLAHKALAACRQQLELDPENSRAHYFIASMLDRFGDREAGRRHAEIALHLRPNDYDTLYNLACYYALTDEPARALELLDLAINTGQGFREWIEHDSDLASLRGLPRYRQIMARLDTP